MITYSESKHSINEHEQSMQNIKHTIKRLHGLHFYSYLYDIHSGHSTTSRFTKRFNFHHRLIEHISSYDLNDNPNITIICKQTKHDDAITY